MAATAAALERAMRFQEVILDATRGKISWWQAAEILGLSPIAVVDDASKRLLYAQLGEAETSAAIMTCAGGGDPRARHPADRL